MFQVIGEVVSCIFWGVLTGLVFTVILFYFPKMITNRYSYSLPGFFLLIFALVFITIQGTLFTGGVKAKKYIPSTEKISSLFASSISTDISSVSAELSETYPMLGSYIKDVFEQIDNTDLSSSVTNTAQFFSGKIQRSINKYLWRRVGWIVGCIFLIGIYMFKSANKQYRNAANAQITIDDWS